MNDALPHDWNEVNSLLHEALNHGKNFGRGALVLGWIFEDQHRSNVEGLKIGPTSDSTYMFKVSKR